MATYYRVNLRDKKNNIVYPNIHNLISIDNKTGAITSPGGFIGLASKASADSDGNKINTTYLKLSGGIMVGHIDMTNFAIGFNNHQGGIRFKMTDGTYEWGMYINNNNELRLGYNHMPVVSNNNFYAQTNATYNLGTSEKKWKSIYISNAINSSNYTSTHIEGNKGNAIINSTAKAGYNMLARQKSTNGIFTLGVWDTSYNLFYTEDSIVANNENKFTKNLAILGEDGNSNFPGTVYMNKLSASSNESTINGNRIMLAKSDGTHWGFMHPNGYDTGYIRTTESGIIPYKSGGSSRLGTESWPFLHIYANDFHGYLNGTASSATYATNAHYQNVYDTRNNNPKPSDLASNRWVEYNFKNSGSIGISGLNTYGGLLTVKPWGDKTGGDIFQLYFGSQGDWHPSLTIRKSIGDWTGWRAWMEIPMSQDRTVKNFVVWTISNWNNSYSNVLPGTVAFCY